MIRKDERVLVARSMVAYGGSFVGCLGKALFCADATNTEKIKYAFPEYWKKYKKLSALEIKDES